jgi:uncharacterized protein (DUF1697 family)
LSRRFAFLRAINVGGHTVSMARLKALFEELDFVGVETVLASGNVIFEAGREQEAVLRRRIEAHLQEALGYEVETFLRTEQELAALVGGCPFSEAELDGMPTLNVAFLHAPLGVEAEARLQALRTEVDAFRLSGRELWWACRLRQSESTFSNKAFETAVKARATFRGFKTLQRLADSYLAP